MFLVFDFDEICDGVEAGAMMGIKGFITIGLLALPLGMFKHAEGVAIPLLAFCFIIAAFFLNIATIVNAIKKIKDKKANENMYDNKVDYVKLKRNGKIVILSMIILSIIGAIFPLYFNFLNLKFNQIPSMILLPFLFNVIFVLMLSKDLHTKDMKKDYINEIKEYFIGIVFGVGLLITGILFFLLSFIWVSFTQSGNVKIKVTDKVHEYTNFIISQVQYYDEKYEENRPENFTIENTVEEQMKYIITVAHKDENEIKKIKELNNNTTIEQYKETVEWFIFDYLDTDFIEQNFNEKYGLEIEYYQSFIDTDYEGKIGIIKVTDRMYNTEYYYKYDYQNCKILETYNNHNLADYEINKIKEEIKNGVT